MQSYNIKNAEVKDLGKEKGLQLTINKSTVVSLCGPGEAPNFSLSYFSDVLVCWKHLSLITSYVHILHADVQQRLRCKGYCYGDRWRLSAGDLRQVFQSMARGLNHMCTRAIYFLD